MSETEYRIGKLIPVEMKGSIEEICKAILEEKGYTTSQDGYPRTYQEKLEDFLYQKYYFDGDCIYEVAEENIDYYDDVFKATKNEDGTISFVLKYYNGGCCFSEAMNYAFDKMSVG